MNLGIFHHALTGGARAPRSRDGGGKRRRSARTAWGGSLIVPGLMGLALLVSACGARPSVEVSRADPRTELPAVGEADRTERRAAREATRMQDLALRASPLPDGAQALETWLAAIGSARETIRLKTFIFRRDPVGRRIETALLSAADRGVRVELLLDDFFHRLEGGDLSRLDAHSNVTVRLFNPYGRALPAPVQMALEHPSAGRRMHNKMLLVDDRLSIIGGRNVADEYFRRDPEYYFADFDLLVEGPGVARLAPAFDHFWQDPLSVPLHKVHPARAEAAIRLSTASAPAAPLSVAGPGPGPRPGTSFEARASLHWDAPDRVRGGGSGGRGEVEQSFLSALAGARREVLIVTPYLIPEAHGARLLADLAARGVEVRILTNSHASTNHPSVHAGYRRYRRQLLEAGVQIHEFRGNVIGAFRQAESDYRPEVVMHAKLAVIDRRVSLVGSPNFDPRSLQQNTEILMRLDSAQLAEWMIGRYGDMMRRYSFALSLGEDGKERWMEPGSKTRRRATEPVGAFIDGAVTTFFQLIPFDQHL